MIRPRPLSSRFTPPQLVVLSFVGLSLLGTLLLALPLLGRAPVSVADALLTAVSAVCLNGLSALPLNRLNGAGQLVVLLLVQLGGLLVVVLGTVLALTAGRRAQLGERLRLAAQLGQLGVGAGLLVRRALLYALVCEGVGTLLLWLRFGPREGWGQGLFSALFHAVMAYNNTGLSLYPQGLRLYAVDPLVSLTLTALSLAGGLGLLVQLGLSGYRRGRRTPLSLHIRLVLLSGGVLLALGTLGVLALEWGNPATLGALAPWSRPLAALTTGVASVLSGQHTLDISALRPTTLLLLAALMFVGAAPASTGGGVRTTTALLALGGLWRLVTGRADLVLFRRRIEGETLLRALALLLLSGLITGLGAGLLLASPGLPARGLLFESVSAVSGAGLGLGVTAALGLGGKLLLTLLILTGRVLPLALVYVLGSRPTRAPLRYPPEHDVLIG